MRVLYHRLYPQTKQMTGIFDMEVEHRPTKTVVTIKTYDGRIINQYELPGGSGYLWTENYNYNGLPTSDRFDTTEIDKYIKRLETEVAMTSK